MAPKAIRAAAATAARRGRSSAALVAADPRINADRPDLAAAIKAVQVLGKSQVARSGHWVPAASLGTASLQADFNAMGVEVKVEAEDEKKKKKEKKKQKMAVNPPPAINRGLDRKKKNAAGHRVYRPLNVGLPDGAWVLLDPLCCPEAVERLDQIPPVFRGFSQHDPAHTRIIEFNLETRNFRCRICPPVLVGRSVEYTRWGPQIVEGAAVEGPAGAAAVTATAVEDVGGPEVATSDSIPNPPAVVVAATNDKKRRREDADATAETEAPAPRRSGRVRRATTPFYPRPVAYGPAAGGPPPAPTSVPAAIAGEAAADDDDDDDEIAVVQPPAKRRKTALEERVAGAITRSLRAESVAGNAGQRKGKAKVVTFAATASSEDPSVPARKRGRPSKAKPTADNAT
nr:hypothetical protein CFP56_50888 [Quercus suber]